MRRFYFALLVSAIYCGTGGSQNSSFRLQLSSGGGTDVVVPQITMQGGETKIIELVALGTAPGPVTFSAQGLPAFGRLEGPILTLSPARADRGEYAIVLEAKSGSQSATTSLALVVNRYNSPPQAIHVVGFGDDHLRGRYTCPSPFSCTANGTPLLHMASCDPEGDGMTIDVEVVIRGQPFLGRPTYSKTTRDSFNCTRGYFWNTTIQLPGLTVEQSYDFALRVTDEFGATEGWTRDLAWGFDQGPCSTRQCACMPSITFPFCEADYECCSGTCSGYGGHCL